jgi:ribosomal protein L37AE/L43A
MGRIISKTGKQVRPKNALKGKRFRCAKCRKRSPKPVKTSAPWYCPNCLNHQDKATASESGVAGKLSPAELLHLGPQSRFRRHSDVAGCDLSVLEDQQRRD